MKDLTDIVGSKSRAAIFRLLFEKLGSEHYLREMQRQSGLSIAPIQQELDRLKTIGLVKVRKDGNRTYYSANSTHLLSSDIHSLVEKTSGATALLQQALSDPDIRFSFIFGSVASGKANPESDLDLFVIGDLGLRKVSKLLRGISERIGREINPHVMTVKEFTTKLKSKDHFISSIMGSEKVLLVGDENEFEQLGKK